MSIGIDAVPAVASSSDLLLGDWVLRVTVSRDFEGDIRTEQTAARGARLCKDLNSIAGSPSCISNL